MSYRNLISTPVLTKLQALVDEGTYFVANNAQTALGPAGNTSYTATAPYLLIQNNNSAPVAGGSAINVVPDYLRLTAATAGSGTALTFIAFALYLDTVKRYSSGGTQLTGQSPNTNLSPTTNAQIYCGSVNAAAASAARAMVGEASLRPCVSGTVAAVVADQFVLDFGSIEGGMAGSITVANPEMISIPLPPIIIGPQTSALLYIWFPGATTPTAPTFLPELGYWER